MKFGAFISLSGRPHRHDPKTFHKLKKWELAVALEVVHDYVKEGKVLGPFPADTWVCPLTGRPLLLSVLCGTQIKAWQLQVGP